MYIFNDCDRADTATKYCYFTLNLLCKGDIFQVSKFNKIGDSIQMCFSRPFFHKKMYKRLFQLRTSDTKGQEMLLCQCVVNGCSEGIDVKVGVMRGTKLSHQSL